jgi:hypothetical protein
MISYCHRISVTELTAFVSAKAIVIARTIAEIANANFRFTTEIFLRSFAVAKPFRKKIRLRFRLAMRIGLN